MKFLITHGSFGSTEANWFRWLEKQLKKKGYDVILEQFPSDDWDVLNELGEKNRDQYKPIQNLKNWTDFFEQQILPKILNKPVIFIGHSLSPVFFLHMLEKHLLDVKLAIFVAPFLEIADTSNIWQFYPINKTFHKTDFNWNKFHKRITKSYVLYGDNDPYVPQKYPLDFAEKTNSKPILVKGGEHLGSTFKEFPLILELIERNIE